MQAIILAGGQGTRLGALTANCPKPMLEVGGRPFVEYLVRRLARQRIRRVLFSLSYLPEVFQAHFGDGREFDVEIGYVVEPEPLGTAGALVHARDRLKEEFLVLNGDTLLEIDCNALVLAARQRGYEACMALREVPDAGRFGSVEIDGGRVRRFQEKVAAGGTGWINGGVYWLRRKIVAGLPPGPRSLEREVFPELAARGVLGAFPTAENFIDIGVPSSLATARLEVPRWAA